MKKEKLKENGKSLFQEFKTFISRGNVIDMAVGVVIGSAFGKIITSLVNDVLMPIVGIIIGGLDFSALKITIGSADIAYGLFIQNVVDFLIVAACIFVFIKFINMFKKKEEEKAPEEAPIDPNTLLLEEIRDLLKQQNKKAK